MIVKVKQSEEFTKNYKKLRKKYRSLDEVFEDWENDLKDNPLIGDDLGNGI